MHLATIVLAIAVLAAGCSQSEEGASDGSASTTSTSMTSLATVTSRSLDTENTTTSTSLTTAATASTASNPLFVGEGSALSGRVVELVDFAVGVCGDLLELRCARALWDACMQVRIELGSMLELRVSMSVGEIVEIDDLRDDICSLFEMVQYWELYSILSAKYGENFYRSDTGFFLFRDELTTAEPFLANPWTLHFFPRSCDDECRWEYDQTFESLKDITRFARYLPDDSRMELLRFALDMSKLFGNLHPSAVPMSEDTVDRILEVYESLEVDDECYAPLLADIFSHYTNGVFYASGYQQTERDLYSCIIDQCHSSNEEFFLDCYQCSDEYQKFFSDDCDTNQGSANNWRPFNAPSLHIAVPTNGKAFQSVSSLHYSIRFLFWEVLKYACSAEEIHSDAYADDTCRTVAHNICRIIRHNADDNYIQFGDKSFSSLESAICDLGRALERLPYEDAKEECLRELEVFLTSENSFLSSDGRCNNASQRCSEFMSEFSYRYCGGFEKYFHVETFWKNIPIRCAQDNSQAPTFGESECYNTIRSFCDNDINADRHSDRKRYKDEFEDEDIPIRERIKISNVLCGTLLRTHDPVSNASISNNLLLLPNETQTLLIEIDDFMTIEPETIDAEQTSTQLTSNNFDSIKSAATVCTTGLSLPGDSVCAIELWKSCFNLFHSKAKHESNESEVYRSAEYVCAAAWIAELARMASALASSFPQDYRTRRFNSFSRYIAGEAASGGILSIDEAGKARPNPNLEDFSPETAEALTALGTSIAKLIQPYLPTPNTQPSL